jgi:hypothetical protein
MQLLEFRRGGPEICKTPQFSCTSATEPAEMGQGKGKLDWVALFCFGLALLRERSRIEGNRNTGCCWLVGRRVPGECYGIA